MTEPRLLVLSLVSPEVRAALSTAIALHGLGARLGDALFAAENWHQSWSDRFPDTPPMRERLRRACARVAAPACSLTLNRIGGETHWTALAHGEPAEFTDVLTAVQAELLREGLDASNHRPHVTLSYRPPEPLPSLSIRPIPWRIDEILLVRGCGQGPDYHYEVLGSWGLQAMPADAQLELFCD